MSDLAAKPDIIPLKPGHFYFWKTHSSPRERRLTLAQYFSAG